MSKMRKPTGRHPRKVDWTETFVTVDLIKNPAAEYIGVQAVRDGRKITDEYRHLVFVGAGDRPVYVNDNGEVLRVVGQSGKVRPVLLFENPVKEAYSRESKGEPKRAAPSAALADLVEAVVTRVMQDMLAGFLAEIKTLVTLKKAGVVLDEPLRGVRTEMEDKAKQQVVVRRAANKPQVEGDKA